MPTPPCTSATPAPVHRLVLRVCLTSPYLLVANAARPWLGAPHLRHIHSRLPFTAASFTQTPRSPPRRKCVGEPRTGRPGGGLQLVGAPSSREDGRRARRAPHEAMAQDGETRGLRPSVSLSAVYLKTPWRRERVRLGHMGVGVPQLHRVRTAQNGETCYCVPSPSLILGDSVSLRQDDWYETLWEDDHSQRVSQHPPRPPRTPPCLRRPSRLRITRHLPFPQRVRRVHPHSRPPTAPTPRTVSTYAIVPYTVSAAWAPAIPRTIVAFRIRNLNGAQMDREVWGCYACVQGLARRGGRRREQYGMGRGAMEAPARRSGAEPRRTGRVLGGTCGARWGSGCGRSSCVSPEGGGCRVYMCVGCSRALASATYHPRIPSHRNFPIYLHTPDSSPLCLLCFYLLAPRSPF
ncbi:hypothetical protein B0H14DRAFT_981274 [Mycena olivaceomarginata]|nr:hypothetical protein B0H14DRAFT_981274 [Mycena olivaceomarginata]